MKNAIRLLATDLDRTLLGADGRVSLENRAALHRAHEAGIKVVLCTGRAFTETRNIIDQIGLDLDATITVNGALISDAATGHTLESSPFGYEEACEVARWFLNRGHSVLWLIDRDAAGFDGYAIRNPGLHAKAADWLERSPVEMEVIDTLPPAGHEVLRITIVDDTAALEQISSEFTAAFDGRYEHNVLPVVAYQFIVIETFAPGITKWHGIRQLCKRWRIPESATAAIGDDVNDVAMIRHARLGAAVANAHASVKAVARIDVAHHDEHGVAEFIDQLLAGGYASLLQRSA